MYGVVCFLHFLGLGLLLPFSPRTMWFENGSSFVENSSQEESNPEIDIHSTVDSIGDPK